MTLPSYTKTIDDAFLNTWYEINAEAADNILNSNVITAALKDRGCFKTQKGGDYITRRVRYGQETATHIAKGDTLPMGEPAYDTQAAWTFRFTTVHVQRDALDDRANSGKYRIKDYVKQRLDGARDALNTQFETDVTRAIVTGETGKYPQGLNDMICPYGSYVTGSYGGITRSTNLWWTPEFKALTTPIAVNLLSDMKHLYNNISKTGAPPNLILMDQYLFEIYEDYALDMSQLVINSSSKLADLGYTVYKFKGKDLVMADAIGEATDAGGSGTGGDQATALFLNTDWIDVVYDPSMWFDMTNWKDIPLQTTRIAHILSAWTAVSNQLRRHGRLYEA